MDDKEIHRLLFSAVQHHNESLLDDLLESEDGPRLLDLPGDGGNMLLHAAVLERDLDCIRCLLRHGADPNIFDLNKARSPLHLAVELGITDIVLAFLELQHVNLELRDDRNLSCFEIAQFCDNQKLADLILDRQNEIEKVKNEFYTIMNQACSKSDVKLVRELVARHERRIIQSLPKSWYHHRDKKLFARNIIKDLINWSSSSWNDVTLLFKSASKGHTEICQLLIELGATAKCIVSTNYSPLYVAAYGGHTSTVKLLLDNFPALIQEVTIEKWTVLHACCLQGHSDTASLILNYPYPDTLKRRYVTKSGQYEYNFAFNLNSQDAAGQTVIYLAVSANNESLLDTLLEFNIEARRITSTEDQSPSDESKNRLDYTADKIDRARVITDRQAAKGNADSDKRYRFYPGNQIDRLMRQLRRLQFSKETETVENESCRTKEPGDKFLICPFDMNTYCDYNSKTALHLAVCQQNHTTVTTLLVNGSDPNLPILFRDLNKTEMTPTKAGVTSNDVSLNWMRSSKSTCLKEACKLNDEGLSDILIRYGARDTQENAALKVAVANKNNHLTSMFLSLKSNIDQEHKINRKCNVEFASRYKQSQKLSKTSELGSNSSATTFSSMFPSNPVTIDWQNLECIQHLDPQWLIDASLIHNKRLRHPTNSLMAITRLDLSSNNLKSVHPVIFRLPSLRELNLADNRLESLLDISQLSHDAETITSTSKLIESHRTAMKRSKSSSFTGVNLESSNRIDLNEPQDWDLPVLEMMDLHNNMLISLPDCLFDLPKLRELDVSSNQLRQLPWAMWTAASLREMIASGNLLDDLPKAPSQSVRSSGLSSPLATIKDQPSDGKSTSTNYSNTSFDVLESSYASSVDSESLRSKDPPYFNSLRANQIDIKHETLKSSSVQTSRLNHWSRRIDLVDCTTLSVDDACDDQQSTDGSKGSFSRLTYLNLSHNSFIMIPPVLACVATELTRLNMSYNRIESLGDISLYPAKLKTLDLSNNRLISWFQFNLQDDDTKHCYTENLRRLSLARGQRGLGQLHCVHKTHQRLDHLKSMNLSHNLMRDVQIYHQALQNQVANVRQTPRDNHQLSPIPGQGLMLYPNITALDVSYNHIKRVPENLSDLKDLSVLNLSGNPSITSLPAELGLATKLWNLGVNGCNLGEPLKSIIESKSYKTMDIIGYLRSILEEAKPYARMKLMLVGLQGIGKTSLLEQMRSEGSSSLRLRAPEHWTKRMGHSSRGSLRNQKGVTLSTVGVDIHDWIYQKRVPRNQHNFGPVSFSTWDFGGQREFSATHRYFLSRRSIYLVVWRLTDGIDGITGIQQWLVNIQSRAPGSPVIIVGTHEDLLEGGEKGALVQQLQSDVHSRFMDISDNDKCGLPKVVDSVIVSTKTKLNIKQLCNRIYDVVFSLRCPGSTERLLEQKIPATYLYLEEIVCWLVHDRHQKKREPVLTYDEYRRLTSEQLKRRYNKTFRDLEPLDSRDINYNSELQQATRFLHENGVLLHYEDSNLRDLYFLDPQWLCDLLSHVVTIREINPHVKNGLMRMEDLDHLFKSMEVRLSGGVQSYVVNLLNKFEVALTWNSQYLLIPSLLPDSPNLLNEHQDFHVKSNLKMRGRSVVKRNEANRSAYRSSSIDPMRRQKAAPSGEEYMKNFYTFHYKPERSITRLVLLRYLPAGFLGRLQSSILSDPVFDEACESLYQDLVERVASDQDEAAFASSMGSRSSWLCWQNGIRLTMQQEPTINSKNDPALLAPELITIEQFSGDSNEFSLSRSKFKLECLQIDCVDKQDESLAVTPKSARKWADLDLNQYSNVIMITLPNPTLNVTRKEDESVVKSYELDHSTYAKLLAKAVDYIDDLLEDWYPSLGARFAHTLGGEYLVTRIVPCSDCFSSVSLAGAIRGHPGRDGGLRLGRTGRAAVRQTAVQATQSMTAPTSSEKTRQENNAALYCFYVEQCILNAYDLTAPLPNRQLARSSSQSPKKSPTRARNLYCPVHGTVTISRIAPDILFDDVIDSLKIDNEHIDRCKLIGRGALGFVFKGNLRGAYTVDSRPMSEEIALKVLQPVDPGPEADQTDLAAYQSAKSSWSREPFQSACKSYCTARHEVNILQTLHHPNIVAFIGLCLRPLAIVLDLAPLGSLVDVFKNYKRANMRLDPFIAQKSILQVAKALEFLHQHRIIYRDLKTENILVWSFPSPFATHLQTAQVYLKLADYGISRQALSTGIWKGFAGTMSFLAPEILRHNGDEEYTEKVDCFSFGMFMYELLTLRPPYNKQGQAGAGQAGGARSHFSDNLGRPTLLRSDLIYPNYMLDLMSLCWSQEPHDRPTASQLVSIASTPEFMGVHDVTTVAGVHSSGLYCAVEYDEGLSLWCAGRVANSQLDILSTCQDRWTSHERLRTTNKSTFQQPESLCFIAGKLWFCHAGGLINVASAEPRAQPLAHQLVGSPSPDQVPLIAYHGNSDDENTMLDLHSFQLVYGGSPSSGNKTMGGVKSLVHVAHARTVVFLTVSGRLWLLPFDKMVCEPLEDCSISYNCISLADKEIGDKREQEDDGTFKLYCGQLGGISCLEICNQEIRRQSILPLSTSESLDDTLDEVAQESDRTQTIDITNILVVGQLLWTSAKCTVHLWDTKEKHVTRKLGCWKLVPCSESLESINIEQYYQQAKTSTITSMVYEDGQLYVATSHGCLIVIEARSLKPMTVFRPFESNATIMAPSIHVPTNKATQPDNIEAQRPRRHLVALGCGHRDLMKRYLNFLEDTANTTAIQPVPAKTNAKPLQELTAILLAPTSHYDL